MTRSDSSPDRLLISDFYTLYSRYDKGTRNSAIGLLLISTLFAAYTPASLPPVVGDVDVHLIYQQITAAVSLGVVAVVGDVTIEDVREMVDIVIKYTRVSGPEQESDGNSLESQDKVLSPVAEELDPESIITVGDQSESADTMMRPSIEDMINIVQNSEGRVCLLFRRVDRLSRADPLEACVFLWKMKREDVVFYFHDVGFVDFTNIWSQLFIMFKLISSRDEYLRIIERGDEGQKDAKERGEFPGPTPYGFTKAEDDDKIQKDDAQAEVIQRGADLLLNGLVEDGETKVEPGNVSALHAQLKREAEDFDAEIPSYNTLRELYRKEYYTGVAKHGGEVVGSYPEIIPPGKFEQLQEVLSDRTNDESDDQLDHELKSVIDRFGVDASLEMFDQVIKGKCPRCGGDVEKWGSVERFGRRVNNYRCEHYVAPDDRGPGGVDGEQRCDFEGPLLSPRFVNEWQSTVPLVCPACQQPLADEDWTESPYGLNNNEQVCDNCDITIILRLPDSKFERAQKVRERIDFFAGDDGSADDVATNKDTSDDDNATNTGGDEYENYRKLTEFA